ECFHRAFYFGRQTLATFVSFGRIQFLGPV
ncbi:MAG: hypothetical protein ACI9JE_000249, partial [Candidatus Krumholzibacteriia bacterium]